MWTPPNDPAYWWRLAVQIAEALGTIGVVVIALGDKLRSVFYKPKLNLEITDIKEGPPANLDTESISYSCELIVENIGKTSARGCSLHYINCTKKVGEVFVKLDKRLTVHPTPWNGKNKTIIIHPNLPPMSLVLLTSQPKAANANPALSQESEPIPRAAILSVPLVQESGDLLVLEPGDYVLDLAVVDERSRCTKLSIIISHSGQWYDRLGRMKEHLSVKVRHP
jgi:hypothetical protein